MPPEPAKPEARRRAGRAALFAFALSLCVTAPSAFAGGAPPRDAAAHGEQAPLHFGIARFTSPDTKREFFENTRLAISRAVAPRPLKVTVYPNKGLLEAALDRGEIDIVLSGAGVYRRRLDRGLRDVATMVSAQEPDPDHAVGSVFIVRDDHPAVRSLADLKGETLAARHPLGFQGLCIALGEIARAGFDPDAFFSAIRYVGGGEENVVQAVASGRAAAGVIRTCWLEDTASLGKPPVGVRPVLLKAQSSIACRTSTDLYPNWSLSVTPGLTPQETGRIVRAIHSMKPAENGMAWTMASDFQPVDKLNRALRIGPYQYLRGWTLRRFWQEHRTLVIAFLLSAAGLLLHGLRASYLVRKRTAELKAAAAREMALEASARETSEKLGLQLRINSVSQLSSLVAHELSQPLSAIACYARLLQNLAQRQEIRLPEEFQESVEGIGQNAARASAVLKKVRQIARGAPSEKRVCDLNQIASEAAAQFRQLTQARALSIEFTPCGAGPIWIEADRVELELALFNLLKNAKDACAEATSPSITIRTGSESSNEGPEAPRLCFVSVSDNGPAVSGAQLERMQTPLVTSKPGGLGLGIAIVRSVAERHCGELLLRALPGGGLEARLRLPLFNTPESEKAERNG